jgi:hypothetical protein
VRKPCHSFKGWESRFVIALLADATFEKIGAEQLFYVALTRCREGVFFVNTTTRVQRGITDWDSLPQVDNSAFADFVYTPVREGEEEPLDRDDCGWGADVPFCGFRAE